MTEDEAKTKSCCRASHYTIAHNGTCRASDCMAWRWLPGEQELNNGEGYCGLAGNGRLEALPQ